MSVPLGQVLPSPSEGANGGRVDEVGPGEIDNDVPGALGDDVNEHICECRHRGDVGLTSETDHGRRSFGRYGQQQTRHRTLKRRDVSDRHEQTSW
jgi:hypothetical protein